MTTRLFIETNIRHATSGVALFQLNPIPELLPVAADPLGQLPPTNRSTKEPEGHRAPLRLVRLVTELTNKNERTHAYAPLPMATALASSVA